MRFNRPSFARKSSAGASTSERRGHRTLLNEAGYQLAGSGEYCSRPPASSPNSPRRGTAPTQAAPRSLSWAPVLLAALVALDPLSGISGLTSEAAGAQAQDVNATALAAIYPADDSPAAPPIVEPAGAVLSLPVFYIDAAGLEEGTLRALKDEVAAQLAKVGIAVTELDTEGMSSGQNVPEGFHLGVMLLNPTRNGYGHGGRTIGLSTREEPERGYNAVHIFVSEVESTLDACSVRPFPTVVGTGAGRAAVHEIIHTLVPALEHADGKMDIMYPSWTCNALMKDGVGLNAEFADAVRRKLADLTSQREDLAGGSLR